MAKNKAKRQELDVDVLAGRLNDWQVRDNLEKFLAAGISRKSVFRALSSADQVYNFELLKRYGMTPKLPKLFNDLKGRGSKESVLMRAINLAAANGQEFNIDKVIDGASLDFIVNNFVALAKYNPTIIRKFSTRELESKMTLPILLSGLLKDASREEQEQILSRMYHAEILQQLDLLVVYCGVDIELIMDILSDDEILENAERLLAYGAKIDFLSLFHEVKWWAEDVLKNIETFEAYGVNPNLKKLLHDAYGHAYMDCLDVILARGVTIDWIVWQLELNELRKYADKLLSHGANVRVIVRRFAKSNRFVPGVFVEAMLDSGMHPDEVTKMLHKDGIVDHLDKFLSYAPANTQPANSQ